MSYLINAANERLTGTLTSSYGFPITIACYVKLATHPNLDTSVFCVGNSASSENSSIEIRTGLEAAADRFHAAVIGNTGGYYTSFYDYADTTTHGEWVPLVAVFTGSGTTQSARTLYTGAGTGSAQSTSQTFDSPAIKYIAAGVALDNTNDLGGAGGTYDQRVAELAIWQSALSTDDINSYLGGTGAEQIDAANLVAYWSLASDATQTAGIDAVGSLSVSGATYDPAHPAISHAVKKLKLLAHSSAASQSSIEGVVLNAARDTVIGEFTGQSFDGTLVSGEAQLLITATDISPNGSTLTTSDTPLAIAYNATYTTPLVSCTVVEV